MNALKYFFTIAFTLTTLTAVAAPTCARCAEFEALTTRLKNRDESAIQAARDLLQNFNFAKDKAARRTEIHAYSKMAAEAIRADDEGECEEYFFNAYEEYKSRRQEFTEVINELSAEDKTVLLKAIKDVQKLRKNGNG